MAAVRRGSLQEEQTIFEHSACLECVNRHAKAKIEDRFCSISCPMYGCKKEIPTAAMSETSLTQRPEYMHCPAKECGQLGFSLETEGCVQCINVECNLQFCVSCREPWHEGISCQEANREWSKEDEKCPQCKFSIEKNGGCPHMSCTNCRSQFCWNCDGSWEPRHVCLRKQTNQLLRETLEELRVALIENEQQVDVALFTDLALLDRLLRVQEQLKQRMRYSEDAIEREERLHSPPTLFSRIASAALDMVGRRQRGDSSVPQELTDHPKAFSVYLSALRNLRKTLVEGSYLNSELAQVLTTATMPRMQYLLTHYTPKRVTLLRAPPTVTRAIIEMPLDVTVTLPLGEVFQ
ncbi:hypothetical protein PROFUN_04347 [Planoprotostelium fungivorum]|uniref:RBR-type E3 ubiquitin transferase n=1 Tax=Planoprotostelium fungivorum TaxID=1890364 RepID=A0A2P6NHN3_9EUKA|nr:hypothetical protein PROFUN_04347 [Planoprotostelium fungivorum]